MEQLQRIDQLEKDYHVLLQRVDRIDQSEKRLDFVTRDSSVKIGIAEGLAKTTHTEISQMKLEIIQLQAELKEMRYATDQHFEVIEKKIDTLGDTFYQKLDKQEKLIQQVLEKLA